MSALVLVVAISVPFTVAALLADHFEGPRWVDRLLSGGARTWS